MKRLLFQAVFLAMGMIMGVYASGDVGLDLMCGALVAVSESVDENPLYVYSVTTESAMTE